MLPKTIKTNELLHLTGYARSSLTELEQAGVIARSANDTWPIQTLPKLIAHLRERKPAISDQRIRWEEARAQREQLKARQLAGELCRTADLEDCWNQLILYMVAGLTAIPARCTRDVALRLIIEREIDAWRNAVANELRRRVNELGRGKAA